MEGALRRFEQHNKPGEGSSRALPRDHPAAINGHTRYPATVVSPLDKKRILKSGFNSKKIGKRVTKGAWKGMPIYTLTLEERATCPRTCDHWLSCYGNNMHWPHRFKHGPDLEEGLLGELCALSDDHEIGFVVRVHVLGDFYSKRYVELWDLALRLLPNLYVYGYTAHHPYEDMGNAIRDIRTSFPDRFKMRFSNHGKVAFNTITIKDPDEAVGAIVCPEQVGKARCCGTCALCWSTKKTIAFLEH